MRTVVPITMFFLVASAMVWQTMAPPCRLEENVRREFVEVPGYACTEAEASELASGVLPADTEIRRVIYSSAERSFTVTAVVSGFSRSSIHRPELCLPSQGFSMSDPADFDAGGIGWRELSIQGAAGAGRLAYTFFNQAGYHTTSHTSRIFRDVVDRSVFGRIDRWTMITVSARSVDRVEFERFLVSLGEVLR